MLMDYRARIAREIVALRGTCRVSLPQRRPCFGIRQKFDLLRFRIEQHKSLLGPAQVIADHADSSRFGARYLEENPCVCFSTTSPNEGVAHLDEAQDRVALGGRLRAEHVEAEPHNVVAHDGRAGFTPYVLGRG